MNKISNLQNALKKAFGEHTEPLKESQWDRLNAAMGKRKSNKRFFPWMFGLALLVCISVGMGYWLGNNSGKSEITNYGALGQLNRNKDRTSDKQGFKTGPIDDDRINKDGEQVFVTKESDHEIIKSTPKQIENNAQSSVQNNFGSEDGTKGQSSTVSADGTVNKNNAGNGNHTKQNEIKMTVSGKPNNENVSLSDNDKVENKDGNNTSELKMKDQEVQSSNKIDETTNNLIVNEDTAAAKSPLITDGKDKDSSTKSANGSDEEHAGFKRFAIGVSSGLSQAKYKDITLSNSNKMHTDTRDLYAESNSQVSSKYINAFLDIGLFRHINLSLSTGVQYRQVQSHENISYKYNQVPFRYPDSTIFGYLYVPDTLEPTIFRNSSILTTRFISVPLALSYNLPIGTRNEVQLAAGVIFNKIISTDGNSFSVNENSIIGIKDRYSKKMSLGYLFGLNYYRNIYGNWWLGAGMQWQRNKTSFEMIYGTINSEINITNYSLNLKYKF